MNEREALDILDLTLLDPNAGESELDELCRLANLHRPASVCVFSEHVSYVAERLEGISISAVAAGFPVGGGDPEQVAAAIRQAVEAGADEIDCVLEPSGEAPGQSELAMLIAMREASANCVLKVIIETPLLDEHGMRASTRMVLAAGADFVKTCTGKRGGCSDQAAQILAFEVMRHGVTMGSRPGIKLSGGIGTLDDVNRLVSIVSSEDSSIQGPVRLRIGASSLLHELV